MIKAIELQNFQSHEQTRLNLSDGVNVIVGSSDSGKSAIIRALRWACWNKPAGNAIRSYWGGETRVTIETAEGDVVRIKGKEDHYQLYRGGEALDFKAFGSNVPQEIVALINFDEVNLQSQHDSPYLISETPGAVAAHFNRVAGLDKIDTAITKVNSLIRELSTDVKYKEAEEVQLKQQLDAFTHLPHFEAKLTVLERMDGLVKAKEKGLKQLGDISTKLDVVVSQIAELQDWAALDDMIRLLSDKTTAHKDMVDLIAQIADVDAGIDEQQELLTIEPLVESLIDTRGKVSYLSEQRSRLNNIISNLTLIEQESVRAQTTATTLEERFHKEMPDVCPLCNTNLKPNENNSHLRKHL